MPSCPGKDQDDDLGPRHCGIPQENLTRVAPFSFCIHSPLAHDFLKPCVCFHQALLFRNNWILGTGSDFTLLRMASRRLEEISKRAMFLNVSCFSLHVQFAVLPHTDQKQPPSPIHLIHTTPHTHTWSLCHALVFISQLNDFSWFCQFMFGNCYCGLSAHFFFFHADSLTRLFIVEKRKDPCFLPERRPERRRNTTSHPECFYTPVFDGHTARPALSCLPVRQPDCLFRLPTSHLTATKTNQIVTNDDLRPGLDYFSFVK